jgi:arylsulfatase A
VVLICADDLGYGDLGCYGSRIATPHIDQMAAEGIRFTQCNAASSVCSPARAGLLTGRYATRTGVPGVLSPGEEGGLASGEITLAQMLKTAGYRTGLAGKWHLGDQPGTKPNDRGFDDFFGLLHSHDMWPRPLLANRQTVEEIASLEALTGRLTSHATRFIRESREQPFFLYLPHVAPHIPLVAGRSFQKKSPLGPYGDVMAEFDWSIGEVLKTLRETGQDDNTIVMLTSDNGPWFQGSPGRLRGRKGESFEGGLRVPLIARMPSRIPAGQVNDGFVSALDVLPTIAALTGAPLPSKPLDGIDISARFTGDAGELHRDPFLYFDYWSLQCARMGRWKVHFSRYNSRAWSPEPIGGRVNLPLPRPELYDLVADPEEAYDCAETNPAVITDIRERVEKSLRSFPDVVQGVWQATMSRPVEGATPAGALPVAKP